MKKIFILSLISVLFGNFVFAYEPLELSDIIKQAKDEAKMAQLKAIGAEYSNKSRQISSEKSTCEKINTKEISSDKIK